MSGAATDSKQPQLMTQDLASVDAKKLTALTPQVVCVTIIMS